MSGINPISPLTPQPGPIGPAAPANRSPSGEKTDFGSMIRSFVDQADRSHQQSAAAVRELVSGQSRDVLTAVTQVAQADLSFKLLIGVRNKIIEAYRQTMNMQI